MRRQHDIWYLIRMEQHYYDVSVDGYHVDYMKITVAEKMSIDC